MPGPADVTCSRNQAAHLAPTWLGRRWLPTRSPLPQLMGRSMARLQGPFPAALMDRCLSIHILRVINGMSHAPLLLVIFLEYPRCRCLAWSSCVTLGHEGGALLSGIRGPSEPPPTPPSSTR